MSNDKKMVKMMAYILPEHKKFIEIKANTVHVSSAAILRILLDDAIMREKTLEKKKEEILDKDTNVSDNKDIMIDRFLSKDTKEGKSF